MPRSLYSRAALILAVPILVLQVVVGVVFVQRHFEGVAAQLTSNLTRELVYLRDAADMPRPEVSLDARAAPLALAYTLPAEPPEGDRRLFYDFSGAQMIETLRLQMSGVLAVDLVTLDDEVSVWLDTALGPMQVTFDRRRVAPAVPHQLLVLMVFTGLLMTVIAFMFLRNQLRPIARLARAAEAFGHGRHEAFRATGATEVRAAGTAFVDMRARIERQIEQRTLMLSGISHDLRTPLTRLKLGLSMLPEEEDTEDMLRDVADMERLVSEFLAFSREDTFDDPEETDPVALAEQCVARYAASGSPVTLAREGSYGPIMLRPMAAGRVLDNLIGNALRYGGKAVVTVAQVPRAVRFTVEDDGPGIPPKAREDALKPFVRLDKSRNQDRGSGVGLGLAIALDIARRHGGSLTLGESAEHGGLRVDFVVPR